MAWQHGVQRTPCQLAMTHFAATRRTETAHFADRIGREVIMQHEALVGQSGKAVDHLLGALGAERRGADRLRFATREQRRSEERRVGKECVSTCRYRWAPYD